MRISRAFWHTVYFFNRPKSKTGIVKMLARKYGWKIDIEPALEPSYLRGLPYAKD